MPKNKLELMCDKKDKDEDTFCDIFCASIGFDTTNEKKEQKCCYSSAKPIEEKKTKNK